MITHWVVGFHGTRYCSTFTEHLTASCNFLSDHIAKKKKEKPSHLFVLVHFISSQGARHFQEKERERDVEPGWMRVVADRNLFIGTVWTCAMQSTDI